MNTDTITKHKWFWAWQDDKEEEWLQNMSRDGNHLVAMAPFGSYTFIQGEPRELAYRLDYN